MWKCIVTFSLGAAACSDLPTPADLAHEQIIAVQANPPVLVPGSSSQLNVLVAGPEGPIDGNAAWSLVAPLPGLRIETDADGQSQIYCEPGLRVEEPVEIRLSFASGQQTLLASKVILVGETAGGNPPPPDILVDGQLLAENQAALLSIGSTSLAVDVDPSFEVAWYNTSGEIRFYRSAETSIEIDEQDPREGWGAAVVRNGEGGVSWRSFSIRLP